MSKKMMNSIIAIGGAVAWTIMTVNGAMAGDDRKLVSAKVKAENIDMSSAAWTKAKEADVLLTGAGKFEGKKLNLKVKSLHTKEMVYFLFNWPDSDKSMGKKKWNLKDGNWSQQKVDEDRLGVVFEINRINKFATKGCAVLCHNEAKNDKKWFYAVSSKKEKADLWHWKSVRSNPAGFTEDTYVTTNPSLEPEKGRKRDAGTGKTGNNRTKDKTKPALMQDPAKPASIPGTLLTTEAVAISSYEGFTDGATIPGYVVNPKWTGSFADLQTKGVWHDGQWSVLISRKIKTGNDDDVSFNTKKKYPFALAVFNNSHEHHSYNSEPLTLSFK